MEVLVVDDDPATVSLVSKILAAAGHTVASASNGAEALEQVEAAEPDAIVLDLQMPVMDGRHFYRELRARQHATPVVILSAREARLAQQELGAEAFVSKPFTADLLVASVEGLKPAEPSS